MAALRTVNQCRRAFTLMELLAVVAVIAILAALLAPTLSRSKAAAHRVRCVNNLHQLGLATHLYWNDNRGDCFYAIPAATNQGQLWWFGWLQATQPGIGEGQRAFDLSVGVLHPYLQASEVRLCPALNYQSPRFKLKAREVVFSYGYNKLLSPGSRTRPPFNSSRIKQPARTLLLADAAQINDFQSPASPENPLLEEFYYLDSAIAYPNGHFRHDHHAMAVFADGHVAAHLMLPGSLDLRLPDLFVGSFRPETLWP